MASLALVSSYNDVAVMASVALAMLASYVALDLAKRVLTADPIAARGWLVGGSITLGIGIWSMHFVGMLAFKLPIMVGYDYVITAVSWLAAVGSSYVALRVASHARLTLQRLALGAVTMGSGICAMHYIGMHAMEISPGIVWDWSWVAASCAIAIAASAAGLIILFWLRGRQARPFRWQLAAAATLGLAIVGMHYTGMAAATFPVGAVCMAADELNGPLLGVLVGLASVLLMGMTLITSFIEARLQAKARHEMQRLSVRDPLTGLPNRLVFEDELERAVASADADKRRLTVLLINLDAFKPVNDSFGHGVGDEVLREVGRRLSSLARQSDVVARVGGDEFVMLLTGDSDRNVAALVAERVKAALSQAFHAADRDVNLSCSIGIVMYPDEGPFNRLMAHAHAAVDAAKRAGGGLCYFYEPAMAHDGKAQIELRHDLRRALEQGGLGLALHYQPKIDGKTGTTTGVEALLRWEHPQLGMISPVVFIPIAERSGLISALGQWVIDEALQQVKRWEGEGLHTRVAINLSMVQLRQSDLVERIAAALERHGVNPSLVTFEVTESAAMEDTEGSMRTFDRLAGLGLQLSVDDFGTGYSSLSMLRKLPAGQLKIDRSFVKDLPDPDAKAIVVAVVSLAHALGLSVVAEGVETQEQERILLEVGCDELQGFLYARPMPAGALTAWAQAATAAEGIKLGAAPPPFRDSTSESAAI